VVRNAERCFFFTVFFLRPPKIHGVFFLSPHTKPGEMSSPHTPPRRDPTSFGELEDDTTSRYLDGLESLGEGELPFSQPKLSKEEEDALVAQLEVDAMTKMMGGAHLSPSVAKTVSPPMRHVFDRLSPPKIVALPGASQDVIALIRESDGGAAGGAGAEEVGGAGAGAGAVDEVLISSDSEAEEGASGDMEDDEDYEEEEDEAASEEEADKRRGRRNSRGAAPRRSTSTSKRVAPKAKDTALSGLKRRLRKEKAAVVRFKAAILTQKAEVKEQEKAVSAITGKPYSVATTALSDAMFEVAMRDRRKVTDVMSDILKSMSKVYATTEKKMTSEANIKALSEAISKEESKRRTTKPVAAAVVANTALDKLLDG
jgi:hypothetical protein